MSSRQDLLIANLKDLTVKKGLQMVVIKKAEENLRNLKLSVRVTDKEMCAIIDELSGKVSYPILDEIDKAETAKAIDQIPLIKPIEVIDPNTISYEIEEDFYMKGRPKVTLIKGTERRVISVGVITVMYAYGRIEDCNQKQLLGFWNSEATKQQIEAARLTEPIIALRKADGSIILKYAGKLRKIDANDVPIPSELNLNSQSQLEHLWTSDKARDYTVDEDKAQIHSLAGTKKNNSNKKAGATA